MLTRARRTTSLAGIVDGQAADQEERRIRSERDLKDAQIGWYWVPDDHDCYVAGKLLSESEESKTVASGKTTTIKMYVFGRVVCAP